MVMNKLSRTARSRETTITMIIQMILVAIIIIPSVTSAQDRVPCKRLLMSGLENSAIFPWIQMSGLYHLYDVPNATFPIYKHDLQDMYFYHNTSSEQFEFNPAAKLLKGFSALIGALTKGVDVVTSPTTPFQPFSRMITGWFQYNPTSNDYVNLDKDTIQPTCLSDDVQTCFSGKIVFNRDLMQIINCTSKSLFIPGRQYFQQIPGLYSSLRPVYQLFGEPVSYPPLYLFYMNGSWMIGHNHTTNSPLVKTESNSTRPEWVTSTWYLRSNNSWKLIEGLVVQCRAWPNDRCSVGSISTVQQCRNGGRCTSLNTPGVSLCQCANGFTGSFCERATPQCRAYNYSENVHYNFPSIESIINYLYNSTLLEGSIFTVWCPEGYHPRYWFSICESSDGCSQHVSWTNTDVFSMVGTTYQPALVRRFLKMGHEKKLRRIADLDKLEDDEVFTKFQEQITEFKQRHPEAEDQYDEATTVELEDMRKKHAREVEEIADRRMTRDQGIRLMTDSKLCSLCLSISWWIWLFVLLVNKVFWLPQFSAVFYIVIIMAVLYIFALTWLIYILNFFDDDFAFFDNMIPIQSTRTEFEFIQDYQPFLVMEAICQQSRNAFCADSNSFWKSNRDPLVHSVTQRYRKEFRYSCWKNLSDLKFPDCHHTGITIVDMDMRILFGDKETRDAFERQYLSFQEEHHREKYHENCSFVARYEISKRFLKHFYVVSDLKGKPWWFKSIWRHIASLLMLRWPYRYLLSRMTSRKEYTLVKYVYLDSPSDYIENPRFHRYVDSSIENPDITCNGACVRKPSITESTEFPPSYRMVTEGTDSWRDGIAIID